MNLKTLTILFMIQLSLLVFTVSASSDSTVTHQNQVIQQTQVIDKSIPSIGPVQLDTCQRPNIHWVWEFTYFSRDHLSKSMVLEVDLSPTQLNLIVTQANSPKLNVEYHQNNTQILTIGENEVPRGLALHHLRERIYDSPLVLEDFKILNKLVYQCEKDSEAQAVFLADSMVSYSNIKELEQPKSWRLYQYRWKSWKHFKLDYWLKTKSWNKIFPSEIRIEAQGEENGTLKLKSLKINEHLVGLPQPEPR